MGILGVGLFGAGRLAATGLDRSSPVEVVFESCDEAIVTNATATDTLSIYYTWGGDERALVRSASATRTEMREHRPVVIRHSRTANRTRVRLAARGSLVRIVAENAGGLRVAVTNEMNCVPRAFNSQPTVGFVAATPDTKASDGETLVVGVDETVTVTSTASDPDYPAERLRYEWDLDGDGVFERHGETATTTYANEGVVAVRHRVSDDFDARADAELTVIVRRPWQLARKLTPSGVSGIGPGDQFGHSVAVSDEVLVSGAPGDDAEGANAGAAYRYDVTNLSRPPDKLVPAVLDGGDLHGLSLALSDESLAVSAVCDDDTGFDAGAVYLYDRDDHTAPPKKLTTTDTACQSLFGFSLAARETTLAVGTHLDDERDHWAGAVLLYDLGDLSASPTKLTPAGLDERDLFGISVALTDEVVVVGAIGDDDSGSDCGAVYVYDRGDLTAPRAKLTPTDLTEREQFGWPVAADGQTLAVGTFLDDERGTSAGAVYVYDLADLSTPPTKLMPDALAKGDLFGRSVALSDRTLAVGANGDDDAGLDAGAVYVYDLADLTLPPTKLTPDRLAPGDQFGFSLALSGDTLAVGALFDHEAGTGAGAVYVYEQ